VGGWLLSLFGVDVAGGGLWFSFFTCLIGAVIFLWILGAVTGKKR
ncbi:MAG: GlsB/YeaQ/YmgE family stress response membrane protein, partial [Candidatus Corynebacterium faecigallinarum]